LIFFLNHFSDSSNLLEARNVDETFMNSNDNKAILRRSNSKKTAFSIQQKIKDHLSQKAPKRLDLSKINETLSEMPNNSIKLESLECSFGMWYPEPSFEMDEHPYCCNSNEKLLTQTIRHRSLGDCPEKMMALSVKRRKLSLPDILPHRFPGIRLAMNGKESDCRAEESHSNGLRIISSERITDQRPEGWFLLREDDQKSTLRADSLYDKIESRGNLLVRENLQVHSRSQLSLPEILPNRLANNDEELNSKPHCNGLKIISSERLAVQRPRSCFLLRDDKKSPLRVNSSNDKAKRKRNLLVHENLQVHSRGKISLPKIVPYRFPGTTLANNDEEPDSKSHCNSSKIISSERMVDQRPQRSFSARDNLKSTLRVNSLHDKIERERNFYVRENLQAHSRNKPDVYMKEDCHTKKPLKSSSVESGLNLIKDNKDIDKRLERNPNKLNSIKHFKGSKMKNSTTSGQRQWTASIKMKELSISESNILGLTRSDRSYTSSTITILKSFGDLNRNESSKTENLTSEVNLESENAQTLEIHPLNQASRNDQVISIGKIFLQLQK